jgi:hypothetical protein
MISLPRDASPVDVVVKGQSGNPSGRSDKPIAVLARSHAPAALKTLARISKDETAPHAAQVAASQAVLDRAYGKAPTFSSTDTTQFKRAIDMTDDELATIAGGAKYVRHAATWL